MNETGRRDDGAEAAHDEGRRHRMALATAPNYRNPCGDDDEGSNEPEDADRPAETLIKCTSERTDGVGENAEQAERAEYEQKEANEVCTPAI